jgi:hypothetical protein
LYSKHGHGYDIETAGRGTEIEIDKLTEILQNIKSVEMLKVLYSVIVIVIV